MFRIGKKVKSSWVGIFFKWLRDGHRKQHISLCDGALVCFFDVDVCDLNGYNFVNNKIFDYLKDGDTTIWEKEPLETLAKDGELNFQRKKLADFNEEQAEIISNRIIQKITNHFANHLKDEETMVDESIEWIEKVFNIGETTK